MFASFTFTALVKLRNLLVKTPEAGLTQTTAARSRTSTAVSAATASTQLAPARRAQHGAVTWRKLISLLLSHTFSLCRSSFRIVYETSAALLQP